jgi:hypothetical protein
VNAVDALVPELVSKLACHLLACKVNFRPMPAFTTKPPEDLQWFHPVITFTEMMCY